jgi:hypothetical protein
MLGQVHGLGERTPMQAKHKIKRHLHSQWPRFANDALMSIIPRSTGIPNRVRQTPFMQIQSLIARVRLLQGHR